MILIVVSQKVKIADISAIVHELELAIKCDLDDIL